MLSQSVGGGSSGGGERVGEYEVLRALQLMVDLCKACKLDVAALELLQREATGLVQTADRI